MVVREGCLILAAGVSTLLGVPVHDMVDDEPLFCSSAARLLGTAGMKAD
jgi:hypothetical protein